MIGSDKRNVRNLIIGFVVLMVSLILGEFLFCQVYFEGKRSGKPIAINAAGDPDPHAQDRERVALNCLNDARDAANCGTFAAQVWPFPNPTPTPTPTPENTVEVIGPGTVGKDDQ